MMDHDRPQLVADMLDYIGHRHIDRLTTRPNKGRDSHIVMILPLRPELRLMPIGPPQEFVTKRYRHEYTLCPQEPPRADPVQTLGRCLLDAFSWKKARDHIIGPRPSECCQCVRQVRPEENIVLQNYVVSAIIILLMKTPCAAPTRPRPLSASSTYTD